MTLVTNADCGGSSILIIISLVWKIMELIFTIIPILLIVMVSVDFVKVVLSGQDDEIKKSMSIAIKRAIACIAIFFVPTFARVVTNLVNIDYLDCIDLAKEGNFSGNSSNNNNSGNSGSNSGANNNNNSGNSGSNSGTNNNNNSGNSGSNSGTNNNNNSGNTGSNSGANNNNSSGNSGSNSGTNNNNNTGNSGSNSGTNNNNSSGNSGSNSGTNNQSQVKRKNIFIGDSRCVGIQNVIQATEKNKSEWICKTGEGYRWFKGTAINTLNSKIKSNVQYNIYINLGVNDMGNVNFYINYYNNMAKNPKYSNSKIIVVSVNPINDSKAKSYGYLARNNQVVDFNNKIKSGLSSSVSYCDVYGKIINNFATTDGIHYTNSTSQTIYNEMLKCK